MNRKTKLCPDCKKTMIRPSSKRCYKCKAKNPEYHRKLSESVKASYKDGELQQRRSDDTKAAWARGDMDKAITEESRAKQAAALIRRWEDGDFDNKYTPEVRARISAKRKEFYEDSKNRKLHSEFMKAAWARGCYDDMFTPEYRQKKSRNQKALWASGRFDDVFTSPSSLEMAVAEALDTCGIIYVTEHRLEGDSHPFDFFVPSIALLIEVDGVYWHSTPRAKKRDRLKDALAAERGFKLLRISGAEIRELGALEIICERVLPITTCICRG